MLDNLRDQASSSSLFNEEEPSSDAPKPKAPRRRKNLSRSVGLTAQRRFFLSLMLFIVVALLGTTLLLITGKVVPPFLAVP